VSCTSQVWQEEDEVEPGLERMRCIRAISVSISFQYTLVYAQKRNDVRKMNILQQLLHTIPQGVELGLALSLFRRVSAAPALQRRGAPTRLPLPPSFMAITQARTNLETLDSMSQSSSYMNGRRAKAQTPLCLSFKTKTRVFFLSDM
jgi:hypothetical protein